MTYDEEFDVVVQQGPAFTADGIFMTDMNKASDMNMPTFPAAVNIPSRGMSISEFAAMLGISDDCVATSVDCEHPQPAPRYYLAGPMSGIPGWNFPAFHAAADLLRSGGYEVVNPAELEDGDTSHPWAHYMRRDLRLLLDCDAVALLPGWLDSKGARLERYVAHSLGMPCYTLEEICSGD